MDVVETDRVSPARDAQSGDRFGSAPAERVNVGEQAHPTLRDKLSRGGGRARVAFTAAAVVLAGPLLVFAWFQMFSLESVAVSDDGAYAVHAAQLQDGGWSVPHLLQNADPVGEFYAYDGFIVTDRGFFLAPRHVVWTSMEAVTQDVFGRIGLRLLPALGLAASTLGAFCLARELGHPRAALGAGALVVTSPILYHSLQLWAHAAVAAGLTASVIGTVRLLSQGLRAGPLSLAVGGSIAASALRGDGFIFSLALAMAFAIVVWRRMRREGISHIGLAAMPGLLAAVAALSHRASAFGARVATGTSIGDVSSAPTGEFSLTERLGALTATLYSTPRAESLAFVLLIVATCLVGAFVYALRVRSQPVLAATLLLGAALVLIVRLITDPVQPASGLIGAWPIALLVLLRPWRTFCEEERMVLLMVGIGVAGVALTQYEDAGGFSWGGRFLSPSVPVLATLAAVSLSCASRDVVPQLRLMPRVGLLTVCVMIPMLYFDATSRSHYDRHFDLFGADAGVYVTAYDHVARADWGGYPDRQWLRVPDGIVGFERLQSLLRDKGILQFTAYGLSEQQATWLMSGPVPRRYVDAHGTFWPPVEVHLDADGGRSAKVVGGDGSNGLSLSSTPR